MKKRSVGRAAGSQLAASLSRDSVHGSLTLGEDPARSALPLFVSIAVAYLEMSDSRDLFLRSADARDVAAWRATVAKGRVEFGQCPDANIVADLLAEHVAELPEPLLCADYAAFTAAAHVDEPHWRHSLLRALVHLLPPAHRATLQALVALLAALIKRHAKLDASKLTQPALTNALAPLLLRQRRDAEPDPAVYPLFEALLSGYDPIFARDDRVRPHRDL